MKWYSRLFEQGKGLYSKMVSKHRIEIHKGDEESWHTSISPIMLGGVAVALLSILFVVLLLIVAYTPILDSLPGYKTNAVRSRETLIHSIVRIDSLERKMNEILLYNENRILVVGGKTPVTHTPKNDSLRRSRSGVAPSMEDSLLRSHVAANSRYRTSATKGISTQSELNAISPMNGFVAERFTPNGALLGVKVIGRQDSPITAIADGVVISSDWLSNGGYCVVIQHKNNFISTYRRLSQALPRKGASVRQGEAIGHALSGEDGEESSALEFELWRDGKAVNPELYIAF